MTKPVLQTFQSIAPMLIQKYERYLPTAFDESMTLLEKMNKIIVYLNQIGELTNGVVAQWNELMEWVLNDGITQEVIQQLDKWLEDGTLATIINETIFQELNDEIDTKSDKEDIAYINVKQYPYSLKGDGSDETAQIQTLLDLANTNGFVRLYFPKGTYGLKNMRIHRNTQIFGDGQQTIFKYLGGAGSMFANGEIGNQTYAYGYNGDGNIKIKNVLIDLNYQGINLNPSLNTGAFALAHAENLKFEDITIQNGQNGHYFQLASVRNVTIKDSLFKDQHQANANSLNHEIIQIEYAGDRSFPTFGGYDLTPTQDVFIENCYFNNVIRGIGNHSDGRYNPDSDFIYTCKNIRVTDCEFTNVLDRPLAIVAIQNSVFSNNNIVSSRYGIILRYDSSDNVFEYNRIHNTQLSGVHLELNSNRNKFYGNLYRNTCQENGGNEYTCLRVSDSHNNIFDTETIDGNFHRYAYYSSEYSTGNRIVNHRFQSGQTGNISAYDSDELRLITIGDGQDVLWEGDLHTPEQIAELTNDIRNYNFIVVVANDSDNYDTAVQTTLTIPKYILTAGTAPDRFRMIIDNDGVSSEKLSFSFSAYKTLKLDSKSGSTGHIRKVIGIV